MKLETERLEMRELTEDDAEFVLRLLNEPSFLENIGDRGVETLDDALRFLRDGRWTNQSRKGLGHFLMEEKASGRSAGTCGLLYRDPLDVIDVGFAFLPDFWGRGYATEAAKGDARVRLRNPGDRADRGSDLAEERRIDPGAREAGDELRARRQDVGGRSRVGLILMSREADLLLFLRQVPLDDEPDDDDFDGGLTEARREADEGEVVSHEAAKAILGLDFDGELSF